MPSACSASRSATAVSLNELTSPMTASNAVSSTNMVRNPELADQPSCIRAVVMSSVTPRPEVLPRLSQKAMAVVPTPPPRQVAAKASHSKGSPSGSTACSGIVV